MLSYMLTKKQQPFYRFIFIINCLHNNTIQLRHEKVAFNCAFNIHYKIIARLCSFNCVYTVLRQWAVLNIIVSWVLEQSKNYFKISLRAMHFALLRFMFTIIELRRYVIYIKVIGEQIRITLNISINFISML